MDIQDVTTFALGVLTGGVFPLITTALNNRHSRKMAHEERLHQLHLEQDRRSAANRERLYAEQMKRIEYIHERLSNLQREYSQTGSYIADVLMTAEDFHRKYLDSCQESNRIRMLIELYFPKMSRDMNKLDGQMNVFWGYQQQFMTLESSNPKEPNLHLRGEVLRAASEISTCVESMQSSLRNMAGELTNVAQDATE